MSGLGRLGRLGVRSTAGSGGISRGYRGLPTPTPGQAGCRHSSFGARSGSTPSKTQPPQPPAPRCQPSTSTFSPARAPSARNAGPALSSPSQLPGPSPLRRRSSTAISWAGSPLFSAAAAAATTTTAATARLPSPRIRLSPVRPRSSASTTRTIANNPSSPHFSTMANQVLSAVNVAPLPHHHHHHELEKEDYHHDQATAAAAAAAARFHAVSDIQADLESKNLEYTKTFPNKSLPTAPKRHYAIVTCMDSRIDNFKAFGVTLGDAHIIRNAGGNARDAFRSLVVSQHMLNTQEIVLIKHTRCGMQMSDSQHAVDRILSNVKTNKGEEAVEKAKAELEHVCFGCWPDVEQSVREDVEWLRSQTVINGIVSGWVYDVDTGRVKRVDV